MIRWSTTGVSGLLACWAALLSGCEGATDPVSYDEFIKGEGEGVLGSWVHSGLFNRTYFLHTPPDLDSGGSYPLAIFLHGGGGTGETFHGLLNADAITDSAGVIAVYPDALEGTWSPGCDLCTLAAALDVDDVAFLQTLTRHLAAHLPVDTTRVFALGYSQGGAMAHMLGCRSALPLAGVGAVAALPYRDGVERCTPSRPLPVLLIHGTLDPLAWYGGYGAEAPVLSVLEALELWRGVLGCAANPVVTELPDTVQDFTTVTSLRYQGCAPGSALLHHRVMDGGHTWPGPSGPWSLRYGEHNRDIDATREMLRLFLEGGAGG